MKENVNELERKIEEEAVKEFGINYGSAKALDIKEVSGKKILPIAVYKNRDHGIDPAVVRIEFYEIREASLVHLKNVCLKYNRPLRRFHYVFPNIKLVDIEGRLEAEIEIVNSQYLGFQLPYGNQYERKILGKIKRKIIGGRRTR